MISISELIYDSDFAQPNGVNFTRRKCSIVNHRPVTTNTDNNVPGIITIADEVSDEMLPEFDANSEYIHVFTRKKLFTTGVNANEVPIPVEGEQIDEQDYSYLSDIVHFNSKHYKVMKVLDDVQYGFSRATAVQIAWEVN